MKKISKLLLTLSAVAVMIVGASMSVMAADYPEIDTWAGDLKSGYTAKDTDGNEITGGWAVDDGIWYYFQSGKMVRNTFITSDGKTYFLGDQGAMHTGWAEFKSDKAVKLNKMEYDNVFDAFDDEIDIIDNEWTKNGAYETLWIFCDENGVLQTEKWIETYGLWYYMDSAFCLTDEWSVELPVDNDSSETAIYGFGKDSNMLVGWFDANAEVKKPSGDPEKPYDNAPAVPADETKLWVYYAENGKQAKAGWNRIDSKWTYFVADAKTGVKLVTNSFVNDGTYDFYFDANGYMVSGLKTFAKGDKYDILEADGTLVEAHEVTATNERYAFDTNTGKMNTGLINGYYYAGADDEIYMIENIATGGAISFTTPEAIKVGTRVNGDFFVVTTDKDENDIVCFYDSGRIVTDEAVSIGGVTFVVTKDSVVLDATEEVKVDGVTYKVADTSLTVGSFEFTGVTRK